MQSVSQSEGREEPGEHASYCVPGTWALAGSPAVGLLASQACFHPEQALGHILPQLFSVIWGTQPHPGGPCGGQSGRRPEAGSWIRGHVGCSYCGVPSWRPGDLTCGSLEVPGRVLPPLTRVWAAILPWPSPGSCGRLWHRWNVGTSAVGRSLEAVWDSGGPWPATCGAAALGVEAPAGAEWTSRICFVTVDPVDAGQPCARVPRAVGWATEGWESFAALVCPPVREALWPAGHLSQPGLAGWRWPQPKGGVQPLGHHRRRGPAL